MSPQDDSEDINTLRELINELNKEINKKNTEIVLYSEKTHILEDEIIKLRELLPDDHSKKKRKKVQETKLQLELEAKDQEMRELKTRMSYLRIENINFQKELKKLKGSDSTVINVEDLREKAPLNVLVKELQEKINKQESLIRRYQYANSGIDDFQDIIKAKDIEIENLTNKIQDLEENNSKKNKDNINKKILTDLQNNLNKLKRQNEDLKSKINEKLQKSKTEGKEKKDRVIELEDEIKTLKSKLNQKNTEINNQEGPLEQVVEELQNKLNKAKSKINILKDQLKEIKAQNITNSPHANESHIGTTDKIKMQRDLASFLQQQLDDAKRAIKTKVEEIGTIKNEAIRIKRLYEDLKTKIQFKDNSIRELRKETLKLQTQLHSTRLQEENPSYELRLQELKSMVEDLTKQNIQLRIRKNT